MSHTITKQVTLKSTNCAACGVLFAMPDYLLRELQDNPRSFYCPNGHSLTYKDSEADRLRRQLDNARNRARHLEDQRDAAERSNTALRGHLTKAKKRAAAGVCPVSGCKRHFQNVAAHIERKHPDYASEVQQ